jgi:hypothetical protein
MHVGYCLTENELSPEVCDLCGNTGKYLAQHFAQFKAIRLSRASVGPIGCRSGREDSLPKTSPNRESRQAAARGGQGANDVGYKHGRLGLQNLGAAPERSFLTPNQESLDAWLEEFHILQPE